MVEETKNYYIAGDSGYPISDNLMKPYPTNESAVDATKRLLNKHLSGCRTVTSFSNVRKRIWKVEKKVSLVSKQLG